MQKKHILQVNKLLQQGKNKEARAWLIAHVQREPKSGQAWWLLSQVIGDEQKELDCLKRVLQLDKDHAKARARLNEIKTGKEKTNLKRKQTKTASAPSRKSPPKKKQKINPGFVALFLLVACLGVVGIGYFGIMIANATSEMNNVPTVPVLVLPTATDRPPQSLPPTWTPTPSPTKRATFTPLVTHTPEETPQPIASFTQPPRITGVSIGQYAPDFTLTSLSSGKNVSLSDYAGKPVILVFGAAWCPYCEEEVPALNTVYKKYKDRGLVILAINLGDSRSKVSNYKSSHQIAYPILLDTKSTLEQQYRVSGIPLHYMINADGKITYAASGMFTTSSLEVSVQALLADTNK